MKNRTTLAACICALIGTIVLAERVYVDGRVPAAPTAPSLGPQVAALEAGTNAWQTAYSWGDHALAGYLLPADLAPYATTGHVAQAVAPLGPRLDRIEAGTNAWQTAYSWGDHALAGYLLPADLSPYATTAALVVHTNRVDNPHSVTAVQIGALTAEVDPVAGPRLDLIEPATNKWNAAYSWGDHALAGYLLPAALSPYATTAALAVHTNRIDNPHSVTATQIGALTAELDPVANAALTVHTNRTDNPHSVTAAQIGALTTELDPVANAALVVHTNRIDNPHSVTAAQLGALTAELDPVAVAHTNRIDNPHAVTATQIGALTTESDPVANVALAIHTNRTDNPHSVTASQIGALTAESDPVANAALTVHTNRADNPHNVTASQIGALTAEADPVAGPRLDLIEAGTNAWQTAYSWGDHALAGYLLPADLGPYDTTAALVVHTNRVDNPHSVTAVQIGALTHELDPVANAALVVHTNRVDNPHSVTAAQVGALTHELDPVANAALTVHTNRVDNPHGVTAVQIGALTAEADPVANAALAVHTNRTDNPHSVTAVQIGAITVEQDLAALAADRFLPIDAGKNVISTDAGSGSIVTYSTLIGDRAGNSITGANVVAIGRDAARKAILATGEEEADVIAIGENAAEEAGQLYAVSNAIAIGDSAFKGASGVKAIAIGDDAGFAADMQLGIAVGNGAGYGATLANSIVIGTAAGNQSSLTNSVAIGPYAGEKATGAGMLFIDSSGTSVADHPEYAMIYGSNVNLTLGKGDAWPYSTNVLRGNWLFNNNQILTTELDPVANAALVVHTNRSDNPHNVTAVQIGAITAELDPVANAALAVHTNRADNPHNVTAAQVGALTDETDAAALAALADYAAYWPHNATASSWFTFVTNSGAITITGYNIAGGTDVVIPDYINGWPVTEIGANAFRESGVTSIGGAGNVVTVGNSAFYYCSSLASVTLPQVQMVGGAAFAICASLTSVSLPQVLTFGDSAFSACTSLASISLPQAQTVGGSAFYGCDSLTSVSLPQAQTLGYSAFNSCTSLTSVSLPQAQTVGEAAIANCNSLASISLPKVLTFGDYAFYACYLLTSLYFDNDAPTIGADIFSAITPNQVTIYVTNPQATGWGATLGGMPVVRPPLHADAIYQAGELVATTQYVADAVAPLAAHTNRVDNPHNVTAVQIGALTAELDPVANAALVIHTNRIDNPHNVTATQIGALTNELDLAALRMYHYGSPDIVESPAEWFVFDGAGTITAFNWAAGRTNAVIPWAIGGVPVTAIGAYAFVNSGVVSLIAPQTVTSIEENAFDSCTSLASVSLPQAQTVGAGAFAGCTSLASVSLPQAQTLGASAFYYCISLTSVSLPQVQTLGYSAFNECTSLTYASLPQAQTVEAVAFDSCTSLTSVSLPQAQTVGDYAFVSCTSLTSVYFDNDAPTIGDLIFGGITPNQVTNYVANPQATGWGATLGDMPVVRPTLSADAIYQAGELVATEAHVAQALAAIPEPDLSDRPTFSQIAASNALPYTAWTGTVTPVNGTATVTIAHGNMPVLVTTAPCVLTLDPTGYGTSGVSRVSLSYYTGGNSFTFSTDVIQYAETPTVDTSGWNTLLIRRVSNGAWKGVGL